MNIEKLHNHRETLKALQISKPWKSFMNIKEFHKHGKVTSA